MPTVGGNKSEDLESCLDYWKFAILNNLADVYVPVELKKWMKGKSMLAKQHFRGVKMYYSLTAPYESYKSSERYCICPIMLSLVESKVMIFQTIVQHYAAPGGLRPERHWLNKVREYFDGREYIARACAASVVSNTMEDLSVQLLFSPRYRVHHMQGEARMCQELADFFNTVHPNEKGIRIAGLYGMSGQGKTTLAKAFCNLNLRNFDCKVCHLEFYEGNTLQRQKLALQCLNKFPRPHLGSVTDKDEAHYIFSTLLKGQRVLLVLDNITDQNIDEVKYYVGTDFGKDSWIILSTRRLHVVEKDFKIDSKSCMHVPSLQEAEAIAILWERKPLVASGFQQRAEILL